MKNKKQTPEDLEDFCDELIIIRCDHCGADAELITYDITKAVEYFFEEGWRIVDHHAWCPVCIKRKKPK